MMWGNKRYFTFNYYLQNKFSSKVFKVPLDAGFTCPNRDGKVGVGGCIYCSARGSGDFTIRKDDLTKQFRQVKETMHQKWPQAKYIGYFQAFTNTYASVDVLREKYEKILQEENVIGLAIATRPDCLPDDVLELLTEINKKTFLIVELGLQTIHDRTGILINRGHDYATFLVGLNKLKNRNIYTVVHIILGLPQENKNEMLTTAREVAKLPIDGIKIHLLHLLKNTPMVKLYEQGNLQFLEKDEYVSLVVDILEILPPTVAIHRLTGDGPRDLLIAPLWSLKKWEVLNAIDRELQKRNTWQGKYFALKN